MQLCFFEDDYCKNFRPLTLTRPVDDLRTGILTIAQKWEQVLGKTTHGRITTPHLNGLFPSSAINSADNYIWINSRCLPSGSLVKQIEDLDTGTCIKHNSSTIAACVDGDTAAAWIENKKPDFNALMVVEASGYNCIENLWDLFLLNGDEIHADLQRMGYPNSDDISVSSNAIFQNRSDIYISKGSVIEPGAILMADNGPIYVGEGATIKAGAMIKGPAAICEHATINMGAKIYPDTTIGPVCKVGGEINNSIFHSYSNKGHDGFLGNSIIGQWCNLGADTNISNLKNNYSMVRITEWHSRKEIETGQQFLGTIMGDHTKTAINTQLNTGTVCGVSCNIFAGDFPPKFIPSFSWVGSNVIQTYKLDKALEAMEAMMARRDVELTEDYKQLIKHTFEQEHGSKRQP